MDALREQQADHYLTAAAIAALAYDIVISFDEEIKYIWSTAWSLPKFLYVFSRYYPLIHICITFAISTRATLSKAVCQGYWIYYGFGGFILIVPVVSLIFFLRVSVIYGYKRRMNIFLAILFLAECSCELATTIRITLPDIPGALGAGELVPGMTGCTAVRANNGTGLIQILAWVPLLCGSSTTFFLTVVKLWNSFSEENDNHRKRIRLRSPLLSTFFCDGVLFFFLIFSSSLILMIAEFTDGPLSGYFRPWFILIFSCSGSRLILNLRRFSLDNQGDLLITSAPIAFEILSTTSSDLDIE